MIQTGDFPRLVQQPTNSLLTKIGIENIDSYSTIQVGIYRLENSTHLSIPHPVLNLIAVLDDMPRQIQGFPGLHSFQSSLHGRIYRKVIQTASQFDDLPHTVRKANQNNRLPPPLLFQRNERLEASRSQLFNMG